MPPGRSRIPTVSKQVEYISTQNLITRHMQLVLAIRKRGWSSLVVTPAKYQLTSVVCAVWRNYWSNYVSNYVSNFGYGEGKSLHVGRRFARFRLLPVWWAPESCKKGAKSGILQVKQLKNGFTKTPPDNFSVNFFMVRVIVQMYILRGFDTRSVFYGRKTVFWGGEIWLAKTFEPLQLRGCHLMWKLFGDPLTTLQI